MSWKCPGICKIRKCPAKNIAFEKNQIVEEKEYRT